MKNETLSKTFRKLKIYILGVVTCTCNPTTLELEFQNGVDSILAEGNSSLVCRWIL